MSCVEKLNNNEFEQPNSHINIQTFNRMRKKFETYKSKCEKLSSENRNLNTMLENFVNSYKTISESKKETDKLIEKLQEKVTFLMSTSNNNVGSIQKKQKSEYATSNSSMEFLKSAGKIQHSTNSSIGNQSQAALLKKIEDLEINYSELIKNFQNMIIKYKIIKEEKDKIEEYNVKLLDQISHINNEYMNQTYELEEKQYTIERFKQIDTCLVDYSVNTLILNTNQHRRQNSQETQQNNKEIVQSAPYAICEPVSSFIKFVNKFTK
jgi:hypothetical protein